MKVYEYEGFPNPARVRMALAELGLMDQVEFISVDVTKGHHKKPEFVAKNPFPAVPVLELEDGTNIAECTAITEYLDNLNGGPSNLTGTSAKKRAIIHMMQKRAESALLDAVAAYFHHATPGLGPDVEDYQNEDWGLHQRKKAVKGMHYFDSVLKTQPFVAGNEYSMADITAYAGMLFADAAGIDTPQECTALNAWRKKVAERN